MVQAPIIGTADVILTGLVVSPDEVRQIIRDTLVDASGAPLPYNPTTKKLTVPGTSPVLPPPGIAIDGFEDLSGAFAPAWTSPAVASPGTTGIHTVATPYGQGFDIVATDQHVATWDSTCKAILANRRAAQSPIGKTERWQYQLFLPQQALAQVWHTGVLWQWHTNTSSGHNLALNMDGTFRILRQAALGADVSSFQIVNGPAVRWGQWIPVVWEIKWSLASDGYLRLFIDGQQVMNHSGATCFPNDGDPYLQFGWYSKRSGLTNRVQFAGIRVA